MNALHRGKLTTIEIAWIVRTVFSFAGITLAFVWLAIWPHSLAVPLILSVTCMGSIFAFSIFLRRGWPSRSSATPPATATVAECDSN